VTLRVDREGLHFDAAFDGSADVSFGGHYGWSFVTAKAPGETLPWPKSLQRLLGGWAEVRITAGAVELFAGRVVFDEADHEFELVDGTTGVRVIVDKWGLLQRPFAGRESVVGELADEALDILRILREQCGIEGWISFGTLLGAARGGTAIGHDSDLDLCYVTEQATPAEMTLELWRILRTLRAAGKEVVQKSGSFLTVEVETSDGVRVGIDLYATFFLDGWFYETATVRTRLERSAVLPLGEIAFEGRMMPAPADPARLLEISYGPQWRVPDPSFHHDPGPEIADRFHGWFSSLWRGRRDWKAYNAVRVEHHEQASSFADWVADQLEPGLRVFDLGGGAGIDAVRLHERGFTVNVLDYGIPMQRRTEGVRRLTLNFYDLRDVLTRGAALGRRGGRPTAVMARRLLETLDESGRDNVMRLVAMTVRDGSPFFVEGVTVDRIGPWTIDGVGGRAWPLTPEQVAELGARHGARVVAQETIGPVTMGRKSLPAWRMTLRWDPRKESHA
jgi:hypothetical protein